MSKADLSKKASLAAMTRLGDRDAELERPGDEPTTNPDRFQGRNGYLADFLNGWSIPLPLPIGDRANDVRELRRGGTGSELKYHNFSVVMSASRRLPMLTAVNINGDESRNVPRISTWSFDGRLNPEDQWGDEIYYRNVLDRGHMVRREDPNWGTIEEAKRANRDTFHFTNSCPQMEGVNQVVWLGLEDHILRHAEADGMRVCVFTGPIFGENDLEYKGALIPAEFWKVVAIVTDDGRPSATAYKVSQEEELKELEFVFAGYKTFQISVRQVMEMTGIDFSQLEQFDGFSQHEAATGQPVIEKLETLEMVRV